MQSIFEALRYPLIVDDEGNLFAFSESNKLTSVHIRRESDPSWGEWFVAAQRGENCSWVASNRGLYVALGNVTPYYVGFDELESIGGISEITSQRAVFSLPFDRGTDLLLWSGRHGLGGFLITEEAVQQVFYVPEVMAFDAIIEDQKITLLGMKQRKYDGSLRSYCVRERGYAATVGVDLTAGIVEVAVQKRPSGLRAIIANATGEGVLPWWQSNYQVEYWMAVIRSAKGGMAIGSIDDLRMHSGPDYESMGLYPAAADSLGIGLFGLENLEGAPIKYFHGLQFISEVKVKAGLIAYVRERESRCRVEDISLLSLDEGGDCRLDKLKVNWGVQSQPSEQVLVDFRVFECEGIGLVAVSHYLRRSDKEELKLFLKSSDGLNWQACGRMPD